MCGCMSWAGGLGWAGLAWAGLGYRAGHRTRKCGYQVSNKLSGMKRAIQSTGSPGCGAVRYLVMLFLPQ